MHKKIAVISFILLSNSVLAPLTANAQVISPDSVTTNPVGTLNMMTTKVSTVQGLPATAKYSVTLTSYNAVPGQTDGSPDYTAIGVYSNPEVIAARSSDLSSKLPYGTIIAVDGPDSKGGASCGYNSVQHLIGYRVIGDAMNARMHNKVDILLDPEDKVSFGTRSLNPSIALGACTGVAIHVVGFVDPKHMPQTQAELVKYVEGSNRLALANF